MSNKNDGLLGLLLIIPGTIVVLSLFFGYVLMAGGHWDGVAIFGGLIIYCIYLSAYLVRSLRKSSDE